MANTRGIPLPPPYKGENNQFPVVTVDNPYCEKMDNFNNYQGIIKLRQGNNVFCITTPGGTIQALNIEKYESTTPALFVLVDAATAGEFRWYDISSGTASLVYSPVSAGGDDEIFTLYFNGYLFYFGEFNLAVGGDIGPQRYDGSTWGAVTYTWPSSFSPFGGNVYKNRAYFIGRFSASYGYSGINSTSGVITKVDLSGVTSSKSNLYIIRSISVSEGVTPDNVQAFLFSNGEIFIYSGAYPDSPNWGLISRFKISKPLYYHSFVDAKGDSFIFTDSEILSLRNLYINGYSIEKEQGIGSVFSNRWKQIITALKVSIGVKFVKGIYDEKQDRLVISLPCYVDRTGTVDQTKTFQVIYDFILGAWYEYFQSTSASKNVVSACYYNDYTFLLRQESQTAVAMQLEGNSNYLDDNYTGSGTTAISYLLRSAKYPLSKFGVVVANALEMIMKSDIYTTINIKFIGNLGEKETGAQQTTGNGTNISKVMFNVGLESNIIQFELYGSTTTSTIGIELYYTNLWLTNSEGLSR